MQHCKCKKSYLVQNVEVCSPTGRASVQNADRSFIDDITCMHVWKWAVEVKPKFHEDADKLDVHVLFEENVRLETGGHSWIKCPEYLLLTYNGRKFKYFLLPEPTYGKIIYSHNWCQGTTMTPEC
jgi:hypothetical protein